MGCFNAGRGNILKTSALTKHSRMHLGEVAATQVVAHFLKGQYDWEGLLMVIYFPIGSRFKFHQRFELRYAQQIIWLVYQQNKTLNSPISSVKVTECHRGTGLYLCLLLLNIVVLDQSSLVQYNG